MARDYPSVRVVNNTPAGLFLNTDSGRDPANYNRRFEDKLYAVFEGRGGKAAALDFLYGKKDPSGKILVWGLWDTVSENFAATAAGSVRTIIGAAGPEKTFAAVELPQLLRNPRVTDIDGIPTDFLRSLPEEMRYPVIAGRSLELSASIKVALSPDGKVIVDERDLPKIDAEEFLSALAPTGPPSPGPGEGWMYLNAAYPTDLIAQRLQQAQNIYIAAQATMLSELARLPKGDVLGRRRLLHGLNSLGRVGGTLSAMLAIGQAADLYNSGQPDAARRVLGEWVLNQVLAYAGGAAVSPLVAMLAGLGPVGVVMGVVLVAAASTGAVEYGDDLLALLRRREVGGLLENMGRQLGDLMGQAEVARLSPLALDLDGDGLETLGLTPASIHFDHDGDGLAQRTGWIGADDGLLVLDHNGDGRITSGGELFGDHTTLADGSRAAHGFAALVPLDGDGNGRLDAADPAWQRLQVWRDADSDAVVDAGELQAPAAHGITALELGFVAGSHIDAQGNLFGQLGRFSRADGATGALIDVWFAQEPSDTVELQLLPVSAAIAALPDLPGAGRVFSLHQSLARDADGQLQALLQAWVAADFQQRAALIDPLLRRWAGVAEQPTGAHLPHLADDRPLAVLEAFRGRTWRRSQPVQNELAADLLLQAYGLLRREVEDRLTLVADVAPLLAALLPTAGAGISGNAGLNLDPFVAGLLARWRAGADPQRQIMIGRSLATQVPAVLTGVLRAAITEAARPLDLDAARFLWLSLAQERLQGGAGADTLTGGADAELLEAGPGNDDLLAAGNDTLIAGPGQDDLFVEGAGALLLFAPGDGQDRLVTAPGAARLQLQLAPGFTPDQVVVRAATAGDDLVLELGAGDAFTIAGFMDPRRQLERPLERLIFADGSSWNWHDLQRRLLAGTPADDILRGSASADRIDGAAGNDQLHAGDGDDTLNGGQGDDLLWGDLGSDLYLFAPGFGRDRVLNDDPSPQRIDTVAFEAGVAPADVRLERVNNDLLLHLGASGDQLLLHDYLAADGAGPQRIDWIRFSDGTAWGVEAVKAMLIAGTPASQLLVGYGHADSIRAGEGDDTVLGGGGDDDLAGNQGNDQLEGGDGHDTLRGGLGNDRLDGGAGRNLLIGGLGNDTLLAGAASPGDSLDGGAGDDQLVGAGGADHLLGSQGRDLLRGAAGNDWIDAGYGDDYVDGGAGDDTLIGGAHDGFGDTLAYANRPAAVRVNLGLTTPQQTGGAGRDSLSGFENLLGSFFADVLIGDDGSNHIDGGAGNDTLCGAGGSDRLIGGPGADTFLIRHRYELGPDSGLGTSRDLIVDFSAGDRLDLSALDADHTLAGNQAFAFIGAEPFSGLGQLRYTVIGGYGLLEGNLRAGLEADFALQLNGAPPLAAAAVLL